MHKAALKILQLLQLPSTSVRMADAGPYRLPNTRGDGGRDAKKTALSHYRIMLTDDYMHCHSPR
jgi:hypothetical protein